MNRAAWAEKVKDRGWRTEYLIVLPAAAVSAIFVWLALLDRAPPVSNVSGKASPVRVERAGVYCIRWTAIRDRVCRREVAHTFVDSTGFVHRPDLAPGSFKPETGPDNWARCYYAPAGASWGRAEHRVKINFYCNPLHNWWPIEITPDPVEVEVVEAPKKPD